MGIYWPWYKPAEAPVVVGSAKEVTLAIGNTFTVTLESSITTGYNIFYSIIDAGGTCYALAQGYANE